MPIRFSRSYTPLGRHFNHMMNTVKTTYPATWFVACLLLGFLSFLPLQLFAQDYQQAESSAVKVRLIAAEAGVAPNASTVSFGLDIVLEDGWKTYWRSPGEVGLPPELDWEGSENVEDIQLLWPAPKRFTAFEIENFGYEDRVVLPISATLKNPGQAVTFKTRLTLLVCANVCIPQDFDLTLSLPAASGINYENSELIANYLGRVPDDAQDSDIQIVTATLNDESLTITAQSQTRFLTPDFFPELGSDYTFGKPDVRVDATRMNVWAQLPLLSGDPNVTTLRLTLTDGARAITLDTDLSAQAPPEPFGKPLSSQLVLDMARLVLLAFLGGLILNVMPCVLPVLSIKIATVLSHQGRTGTSVRTGFVTSFLGVMAFMWILAGVVIALKAAAFRVGWGIQFQNPVFVVFLFLILALFAASLLGLFEFKAPKWIQRRSVASDKSFVGDFATGAFAALLATPCAAPFLGTALAFALTGGVFDTVIIFSAVGVGLGFPYLVFAARPSWMTRLPKPGPWMVRIKFGIGIVVLLTALWALWVLSALSGFLVGLIVFITALALIASMAWPLRNGLLATGPAAGAVILALSTAALMPPHTSLSTASSNWVDFDQREISRLVTGGQTVVIDVTADWCLTCRANKILVLNREPIATQLVSEIVVAMQADWTRADPTIADFLSTHNRYSIPLNVVYGPDSPDGIILPEILTTAAVLNAIETAQGEP
jgi:suppressor for copper-sensitivity B